VKGTVCGPQVPGAPILPANTNYSLIYQCPLNACCDIWGQCGTTAEFCTISESTTGAPGTAAPGTNGCISNCGTEIIIGDAPAQYLKIGFFEGYDTQRPCLNERLSALDLSPYTHIFLSFAAITPDFDIDVSSIQSSFDEFIGMAGFKKIISIGGWAFSTDPSTYMIYRDAMSNYDNRNTFVSIIVTFLAKYGLDGVNFDWECRSQCIIPSLILY
jgi:chitinase